MNEFDALRGVTRRALRIDYISPGICQNEVEVSGSGSSEISTLDILPTLQLAGPATLELSSPAALQVRLDWAAVETAYAYIVYRATAEEGPYFPQAAGVIEFFFVDTIVVPGTYYYKVTGIEPDFGETHPSPIESITV